MAKEKTTRAAPLTPPPSESYTVVARRYRPQQFEDLVGQEPVARALMNALESNRVAHAYLFTGARGVGKTSTARILAKALNCVKGPTAHPCDKCDNCVAITSGEDVDVLEIDGASNRGIDNVRELRSSVQYRPTRARYRIYIIDEVHMLSREAFNALLKTLEEPPAHVKFIFATTEIQKVPLTILSRCQRFDFAGIGQTAIVDRLRQIVQQEGMKAEDDALEMIARRSGGSMRDAQSLLDQLLAFSGEQLTADQVHGLLGTVQEERVIALADAVLAGDMPKSLAQLAEAAEQGVQLGELLDQLMAYWRDLMMVKVAGKNAPDLSVAPRHQATLVKHAESLSLDAILAGLDVLAAARARLRQSSQARTLFEMALVRLGRLKDLVSLSQLTAMLGSSRNDDPATLKKKLSSVVAANESANGHGEAGGRATVPLPDATPQAAKLGLALTPESLPQVLEHALGGLPQILSHHVRLASVATSGPNDLVLRFPLSYTQEKEYCLDPERFKRIEESFRRVLQGSCRVRIESAADMVPAGDGPQRPDSERTPVSLPSQDQRSATDKRKHREEVQKIPLVKAALELLDAQILRLDDEFGKELESNGQTVSSVVPVDSSMESEEI